METGICPIAKLVVGKQRMERTCELDTKVSW